MGFFTHFRAFGSLALASALWVATFCACQPKRDASTSLVSPIVAASEPRSTSVVWEEIQFLIQDQGCTSDSDCVLQPIGTDGCGAGDRPYAQLIYSAPRTDSALLQEKIREFNLLQLQELEAQGPPSTCSTVTLEPTITCSQETLTCSGAGMDRGRGR
jgi:hypothetical protein